MYRSFSWLEGVAALGASMILVAGTLPVLRHQQLKQAKSTAITHAETVMTQIAKSGLSGEAVVDLSATCPDSLPEDEQAWSRCDTEQRVAFGHYGVDFGDDEVECVYAGAWRLADSAGQVTMWCDLDHDGTTLQKQWQHIGKGKWAIIQGADSEAF